MKKMSIEQKQIMYEFLIEKGVPDLYASLIAERQIYSYENYLVTVGNLIMGGFDWFATPEGYNFWKNLDTEMERCIHEYYSNKIDITLEDTTEVVESYGVKDFIAVGTNFNLDSDVTKEQTNEVFDCTSDTCCPSQPQVYLDYSGKIQELTFWQKIKFYAGRLFYRV